MKKRKPVILIGIIILTFVIVVLLGGVILGNYIEDELQKRHIGAYRVQNREADVNVFLRQITLKDAVINDSAANQRFTAPEIKATGIRIFPFVFNEEVIINKLLIEQPEVSVMQKESDEKSQQQEDTSSVQDRQIELIRIKQLEIADAFIILQKPASDDADTLFSIQAGLEIRNLNIFSDKQQLKFNNHSAEQLEIKLTNGTYKLPGDLYDLQFESLNFSTVQKTLRLEDIHFSSLYPRYEIAAQTGVETDWYDIVLEQLLVEGININNLLTDTAVVFQSALLKGLDASIFRDKRPPFPDKPDSKLPMEMLESLPVLVHSDSILIKNGNVIYEEHGEQSTNPGKVTFNNIYASIYNLSTIEDSLDGQTAMTVRAMVMDEAMLKTEFIFPNNKYSYQYQVSGNMEPVKITAFNPMLVPNAFVKVEEGQIKQLNFDFKYDNNKSEGSLALQYENLGISLLNKEDGSKKEIKTFLTETFVLQKDNLTEDNSYQEGTISFEREKKKSIFNYWWKSLFSGIKDILAF